VHVVTIFWEMMTLIFSINQALARILYEPKKSTLNTYTKLHRITVLRGSARHLIGAPLDASQRPRHFEK
jgi:hypothetical protein